MRLFLIFSFMIFNLTNFVYADPAPTPTAAQAKLKTKLQMDFPHIVSLGETEEDSPWSGITRKLLSDVQVNIPVLVTLRTLVPELCQKMDSDSSLQSYKDLWGKSINFDQEAKKTIVNTEILKNLAVLFGSADYAEMDKTPGGSSIVHAGLAHTYGYLFSNAKTQYGYKRERWVRGEMEKGLGMPEGPVHPIPPKGTLFVNATYLFGKIAFRQEPERLKVLSAHAAQVSPAIRNLNLGKFGLTRVVETIQMKSSQGPDRKIEIRTDLVPFVQSSGGANTHMLVYSIHDSMEKGAVLISGFPVNSEFVKSITSSENIGENKPIQLKYNAYLEGVWGRSFSGSRKVISVPAIP